MRTISSTWSKETIDKIMSDGKKRTLSEIISVMWDELDTYNKNPNNGTRKTGSLMPTRGELRTHLRLGRQYFYPHRPDFESGEFDIFTGSERAKSSANTVKKYWCEI